MPCWALDRQIFCRRTLGHPQNGESEWGGQVMLHLRNCTTSRKYMIWGSLRLYFFNDSFTKNLIFLTVFFKCFQVGLTYRQLWPQVAWATSSEGLHDAVELYVREAKDGGGAKVCRQFDGFQKTNLKVMKILKLVGKNLGQKLYERKKVVTITLCHTRIRFFLSLRVYSCWGFLSQLVGYHVRWSQILTL